MISGFFPNTVTGNLRAAGQIEKWFIDGIDPTGYRHHESGEYKTDAKRLISLIGGFTAQKESGIAIDFGNIVLPDNSGFMTLTVPIAFNLGEVNGHPDSFFNQMVANSSVGTNFKAFNMRFWMGSLQAFSGLPEPTFYFRNSAEWRRGYILEPLDSSGNINSGVFILPSAMPDCDPNVFSKSPDSVFVSGNFSENEISHFLYIRGIFPSGNYPLGTYGGLGQNNFTFKFSYDWTIKEANVLDSDLCDHVQFTPPELPLSPLGPGVSGHYRLNEHSPRLSVVSGFPGVDMTLEEFSGSPGTQVTNSVGFGSGIVASGHSVSGIAAKFINTNHLQTDTIDCATLDFKHNSADGPVSFCIAGWVNFDNVTQDHGVLGRWHDAGAVEQHQYRFLYNNTVKRFRFELKSRNNFDCILQYHIFNKLSGSILANRWYFFVIGYDENINKMFMRINDLPIDYRQITDIDTGLMEAAALTPFALGCANTRTISGTPTRMRGLIDSVTIWRNHIPNNEELTILYNMGRGLDFPFPERKIFDFTQPPLDTSNPDAGLKESLSAHFSLNRPSGSITWPDDAGPRVLTATFKIAGTIGATSGIIDQSRMLSPSGAAVCSRPLGSGWLQADGVGTLRMEPEHPFTISVWVKLHNLDRDHGICGIWRDIGVNNRHWLLRYISSSQKFGFRIANGVTTGMPSELLSSSMLNIEANRWYLVVIRYDPNLSSNQIDMVIDNQFKTTISTSFVFNTTVPTEVFAIGAYNTASTTPTFSDIDVDALTLWRKRLDTKEMLQIYNNGNGIEWSLM